jgi:hypothetical protein
MPPHCDSLDGPVVMAASRALGAGAVDIVLPFVPEDGEDEIREAFRTALEARQSGGTAREIADRWFFETVVRVHRAGEGAPYTGLKPAGLDVGPVIPVAERAIETGAADEIVELLTAIVADEARSRLARVMDLKRKVNGDLAVNREYVEAMLGFQVWSHSVQKAARAQPHEHNHAHRH